GERLREIPGQVPHPLAMPEGCAFAPRCFKAEDQCRRKIPLLQGIETGRTAACHFPL
ncbi:MAG: ABC transporter ATP-binding protein, partial [Planctomycetes bacterium]|nr:ABC transporter ATP-binding protein [Planctomycetota bacterium]